MDSEYKKYINYTLKQIKEDLYLKKSNFKSNDRKINLLFLTCGLFFYNIDSRLRKIEKIKI